jgi:hypothetical protein
MSIQSLSIRPTEQKQIEQIRQHPFYHLVPESTIAHEIFKEGYRALLEKLPVINSGNVQLLWEEVAKKNFEQPKTLKNQEQNFVCEEKSPSLSLPFLSSKLSNKKWADISDSPFITVQDITSGKIIFIDVVTKRSYLQQMGRIGVKI